MAVKAVRKFFGTVAVYTGRGIFSLRFWGCAVVAALLMISFILTDYNTNSPNLALYYFYMTADAAGSGKLLLTLAVMPAVTLFCEDINSGKFLFAYSRTGKKIYPFAVIVSSGIIAALSMTVTYLIFSGFILAKYPLLPPMDPAVIRQDTLGFPNSGLLTNGAPVMYYVLWVAVKGAYAAVYSALGILLSVFITNIHLTIVSPMLLEMIDEIFLRIFHPPFWMNSSSIYGAGPALYLGFGGSLEGELFLKISAVYPFIFTVILIAPISLITYKAIALKLNSKLGVSG